MRFRKATKFKGKSNFILLMTNCVFFSIPSIFWLPKDTKVPVTYEGDREVESLVKYIAENSISVLKGINIGGETNLAEEKDEL